MVGLFCLRARPQHRLNLNKGLSRPGGPRMRAASAVTARVSLIHFLRGRIVNRFIGLLTARSGGPGVFCRRPESSPAVAKKLLCVFCHRCGTCDPPMNWSHWGLPHSQFGGCDGFAKARPASVGIGRDPCCRRHLLCYVAEGRGDPAAEQVKEDGGRQAELRTSERRVVSALHPVELPMIAPLSRMRVLWRLSLL